MLRLQVLSNRFVACAARFPRVMPPVPGTVSFAETMLNAACQEKSSAVLSLLAVVWTTPVDRRLVRRRMVRVAQGDVVRLTGMVRPFVPHRFRQLVSGRYRETAESLPDLNALERVADPFAVPVVR